MQPFLGIEPWVHLPPNSLEEMFDHSLMRGNFMDSLHHNMSSGPWMIHDVNAEICDELVESQASDNEVSNQVAYLSRPVPLAAVVLGCLSS